MQTLVHADIFFFISTIALVVVSIFVAVGLYFVIGILRDVKEVSARLKKASADIESDLEAFRNQVKAEGQKVRGMADFILGFIGRALMPKPKKRKKAAEEEEDL